MLLTPTMETVVPHVYCVAVMMGGFGGEGVRRFYTEHFINQIPKRCEGDACLAHCRQRPGGGRIHTELHSRHAMALYAARHSSYGKASRTSENPEFTPSSPTLGGLSHQFWW